MRQPYDWALLRVVPRVERGEFVNAGAVVYCQQLDFLGCTVALDEGRLLALDAGVDLAGVRAHLASAHALCAGTALGGANALRPAGERFRWLVAPRSAVLQLSPVHTGVTTDPAGELEQLVSRLVRQGDAG